MYSVVLLAVMSSSGGGPGLGHKHHVPLPPLWDDHPGCHGCWGLPYCGYTSCPRSGPFGPPPWGPHASHGTLGGGFPGPGYVPPMSPATNGEPAPAEKEGEKKNKEATDKDSGATARLVVRLPEGARLFVDGQLIRDAADQEVLPTPRLEKGKEYSYEVRAEVVRDGRRLTQATQVTLTAGQTVRADFRALGGGPGVATARER